MTKQELLEHLEDAAEYIESHGHARDTFFDYTAPGSVEEPAACMIGALWVTAPASYGPPQQDDIGLSDDHVTDWLHSLCDSHPLVKHLKSIAWQFHTLLDEESFVSKEDYELHLEMEVIASKLYELSDSLPTEELIKLLRDPSYKLSKEHLITHTSLDGH